MESQYNSRLTWRTKTHSQFPSKIHCTSISIAFLLSIASLSLWPISGNAAAALPTLPQVFIDTTYSAPTGATCTAANGSEFQTCLNNAALNSTIVLQAGKTYTGNFTLPNKTSGNGWIYIRSSNSGSLPAPGNRVSPADAGNMPKIVSPYGDGGWGVQTASNAHHYRFVGIEMKPDANTFLYDLVRIGQGETSVGALPHHITFDRCYIHGDPSAGSRRGISMNGISIAVIDSYLSDFKEVGSDSQTLWAHNTPGPLKIVNNYLEAAGENVMFGGSGPSLQDPSEQSIPSDIEIRRNHFFKPLSWMNSSWSIKNLLEFKVGRRVLVEGNLLENNWQNAQNGFSVLVTPRIEGGKASWFLTQDITFRYNKLKNVGQGFNIAGQDDNNSMSTPTNRILVQNNIIEVTGLGSADGRIFQIIGGPYNITIDHNTGSCTGAVFLSESNNRKADQFDYKNNISGGCDYGFIGSGTGEGIGALNEYYTNWTFTKNVLFGKWYTPNNYPPNNSIIANVPDVGFVEYANGNYRLSASSPYKNAGTDGKDLGADIDALEAAIAGGGGGSTSLLAPENLQIVQ